MPTSAFHPAETAPPSCLAVRRPTGPARGVSCFWVRQVTYCFFHAQVPEIPGHALHEKGLQRQKYASPLVSSQEEKSVRGPVDELVMDRRYIG